jgi:hypothetical protein
VPSVDGTELAARALRGFRPAHRGGIVEGALGALGALAGRADDAAAGVRAQAGVLRAAGSLRWRGAAADAFGARLEEACGRAAAVAASLDLLGTAVRSHAVRAAGRAEALEREVLLVRAARGW